MPVTIRKSKLSPQLLAHIASMLFDGFTSAEIAFYHDLNVRQVNALAEGLEYPQVKKAVLAKKELYIAKIRDGRSKGWARIAWFLERRWPREFSRPEIQLSLASGPVTNNTLVVSAEVAEALTKRSTRINREIDSLIAQQRPQSPASQPGDAPGDTGETAGDAG